LRAVRDISSREIGAGTFEPQIVKKLERRLTGVDKIALSLYAKGLTTAELSAHFVEVSGIAFSAKLCCRLLRVAPSGLFMWRRRSRADIYDPGIIVNRNTIRKLMRSQQLHGLPDMKKLFKSKANLAEAAAS
jgi:hypothetical protein